MTRTPEFFINQEESHENGAIVFLGRKMKDKEEKWLLTKKDIQTAEASFKKEKINPLSKEKMFLGALTSILSIAEKTEKTQKIINEMQKKNLDTPEKIINQPEILKEFFNNKGNRHRYYKKIFRMVSEFSCWWQSSSLPQEIIEDMAQDGGQKGIEFRDRLSGRKSSDKAPGMGPKIASFFLEMCGYENIAVLDLHMWRFLEDHSAYPGEIPKEKNSGLWLQRYKKFEKEFSGIAKKCGLTPAMFHLSLWYKYRQKSKNGKNFHQ